jgi:hypothetical protein
MCVSPRLGQPKTRHAGLPTHNIRACFTQIHTQQYYLLSKSSETVEYLNSREQGLNKQMMYSHPILSSVHYELLPASESTKLLFAFLLRRRIMNIGTATG